MFIIVAYIYPPCHFTYHTPLMTLYDTPYIHQEKHIKVIYYVHNQDIYIYIDSLHSPWLLLAFPWDIPHHSMLSVVPSMNPCIYVTIMRKINVMYIIMYIYNHFKKPLPHTPKFSPNIKIEGKK